MAEAVFTFYGELNDFLRAEKRQQPQRCSFQCRQSVKHLIESLHIPHPEVGLILINGTSVEQDYLVQDGDQVDVHPFQPSPRAPDEPAPSFLLDNHLGKLAAFLRMISIDAAYRNDYQDDELAVLAWQEERILLTRDRGLLMRRLVKAGYCLRSLDPHQQFEEILRRYHLLDSFQPFQRCMRCNHLLEPVEKSKIMVQLEPLTRLYFNEFEQCPACGQVYWKGSHVDAMRKYLNQLNSPRSQNDG